MKVKNIAWGLFFVAAAGLIILQPNECPGGPGFWSIVISLLMCRSSSRALKPSFGGALIPLAIILIAFDDALGIERFTPWPVLGCAVFLSVGLHFLFPYQKDWKEKFDQHFDTHIADGAVMETNFSEESSDGEHVYFCNRFAGSVKYMTSEPFADVNIRSSFGGTKIYFDSAVMKGDTADVNLDAEFTGVTLYPEGRTLLISLLLVLRRGRKRGLSGQCQKRKRPWF